MNELLPFNFNGNELSIIMIDQNPHFIANEICDILGLGNSRRAVSSLDDDEKLTYTLVTSGQSRSVNIITESGLYSLVIRSKKQEAKAFKKWITSEVLPAIRKTGSFGVGTIPAMSIDEIALHNLQGIIESKKRIDTIENKVKELEAKTITSPNDYFTIAGYASLIGKKVDVPTAAQIGRKATNLCGTLGYLTGTIPDPRFGKVKTYPTEVLKTAFDQYYA